jgi:endonuclease/exonuclease/phosphatase family metal-dependent hydrolase
MQHIYRNHFLILLATCLPFVAGAQLSVSPLQYEFDGQQIHTSSEAVQFIVSNTGDESLLLLPSDISLLSQGAQSTELSILTYNIWFDNQNWPARFAHMLSEIRAIDPDIIGLQEVIQRPHLDNQAQQIADSLGYHYYFNSVDDESAETRFGNAIVSRYPIEETNFRALQPTSDYRNAIHARINVAGNIIDFYNTHLHHTGAGGHIREEQILDLLDFIDETSSNGFVFVTGDFNANPDWEEMELMYEDFTDVYPLFHENHLDPEHSTLNYHLGHGQRRIDYVFFGNENNELLEPVSANIVLDEPDENGVYGSDHFGVSAQFRILSDADDFILQNIEETVELQPGEHAELAIVFAPATIGMKEIFLVVGESEVPVTGFAFDATVYSFPWLEDFAGTNDGQLPQGWLSNAENWMTFESSYAGGEAPELVFWWQPEAEGSFYAQSPQIETTGLDSLQLTFTHSIHNFGDPGIYELRLMSIAGEESHTIASWENPADVPAGEFSALISSDEHAVGGGIMRLAWVFEGYTGDIIRWAVDDIILEAYPALDVSPRLKDFGGVLLDHESDPAVFTLTNIGGGQLTLSPEDILIEGEDAASFLLENITSPQSLGAGESVDINVVFAPVSEGSMHASLMIAGKEVPLSGEGVDATITELPWSENFTGVVAGEIPLGWSRLVENWHVFNTNHAGGELPEMRFWWQPESTGRYYLSTPQIVISEHDHMVLSFKHRLQNFGSPGIYKIQVVAITGETEHILHEWVNPESIPANEFSTLVSTQNHVIKNEAFHLAWVFDGQTDNMSQWDIDDIVLSLPGDTPVPGIEPGSHDFGQQDVGSVSEPKTFVLQNRGGGIWHVDETSLHFTGDDAASFMAELPDGPLALGLFETGEVYIRFNPDSQGYKEALMEIDDLDVSLTGWGVMPTDYFIWSDFTITDNGTTYTNVGGFREVPAFAQNGSLIAEDVEGEGIFGGVVLQLEYNLDLADEYTVYYMWAYPPPVDISAYSSMVLYMKADTEVSDLKVRMQDMDGYQGIDGESYMYVDITTGWQLMTIPVDDFVIAGWADHRPDLTNMHKIDLIFEQNITQPQQGRIYVDLVGFAEDEVDVENLVAARKDAFHMYPNPASDKVIIVAGDSCTITLYDINGKIIKKARDKAGRYDLDVSGLSKGFYFVNVLTQSKMEMQKLIIH